MRIIVAHHKYSAPSMVEKLVGEVSGRLGVEALHGDQASLDRGIRRGDLVYGLFVFEASHVREELLPLVELRGALWRGILPLEVLAEVIGSWCARMKYRRIMLSAHRSERYWGEQEHRMMRLAEMLGERGVKASYGSGSKSAKGIPVVPLAFSRGHVWREACRGASICMPPLLEEGYMNVLSWILGDASRLLGRLSP